MNREQTKISLYCRNYYFNILLPSKTVNTALLKDVFLVNRQNNFKYQLVMSERSEEHVKRRGSSKSLALSK